MTFIRDSALKHRLDQLDAIAAALPMSGAMCWTDPPAANMADGQGMVVDSSVYAGGTQARPTAQGYFYEWRATGL